MQPARPPTAGSVTRLFVTSGLSAHPALRLTLLLLAVWLMLPLGRMVHVEGFSASIESLALHESQGSLKGYDLLFPFNLEFFATSRAGAVLSLAAIYRWLPDAGDAAFVAVMLFGAALLAGSAVLLLRRWVGAGWPLAVLVLLLLPGISESTFFFNDNVLSSGLASAGLAALWWHAPGAFRHWQAWIGGLLLGAAAVVRADAIVLMPAALLSLVLQRGSWRALLWALLALCVAAASVVALSLPAMGFNFLDTLDTAQRAVALWNRPAQLRGHLRTLVLFLGLPGLAFVALGAFALARRRQWGLLLLLAGMPMLYNIVYIGKAWEVRALLPTTVFCAALAAVGLQWLWQRAPRWLSLTAAAAVLLLALAPPFGLVVRDGPRSLGGRLWAPLMWQDWQNASRRTFAVVDRAAAGAADATVLATYYWDEDRYLHLALQQHGWRVVPTAGADCGGTAETFSRGDARLHHLRLHTPMVRGWELAVPDRWSRFVQRCGMPADRASVQLISSPSVYPGLVVSDDRPVAPPAWLPSAVSRRFPVWPLHPLHTVDIAPPLRARLHQVMADDISRLASTEAKPTAATLAPLLRSRLALR